MCGICGIHDADGVYDGELKKMLAAMTHRGPDDDGWYTEGPIGLASNRLSIIDIDGGHMPMPNEDESVWVVHNGEIYNFRALRQDLIEKGHAFRTESDTEVLVHLYEEYGEGMVEHLHGMFAFAIWDIRTQTLLLARDRLGQKPLFFHRDSDRFLFASEIKGITAILAKRPDFDEESLHHFLSLRYVPSPATMFRGIQKLPPGHTLRIRGQSQTVRQYWTLSFETKLNLTEGDWAEALHRRLKSVVGQHLVSDVPIGALLSGGLDSSMIVAMMADHTDVPPSTFAVGVEESDFDELPFARMVAARYKTNHIEERVEANLISLLPRMIWHLDEPSDPIAACQYHAAELASRYAKVILGGDGGDELFAGFDRYYGVNYVRAYGRIPRFIRTGILRPILSATGENFSYKSATQKLRWLDQLAAVKGDGRRYAEATCFFRFNHFDKSNLFTSHVWQRLGGLDSSATIADVYAGAPATNRLDRMLYTDTVTRLPEHSLMLGDRMSMAHSIELRSPFLDHELVEFMAKCPGALKMKGRELKYILRRVAEDFLPPEIVRRPKHGFMFPIAYWFKGPLFGFLSQYLIDSPFVVNGTFRREAVHQLLAEHRSGVKDNHVRLWMLLNLAVWHRVHLEGQTPEGVTDKIKASLSDSAGSRS